MNPAPPRSAPALSLSRPDPETLEVALGGRWARGAGSLPEVEAARTALDQAPEGVSLRVRGEGLEGWDPSLATVLEGLAQAVESKGGTVHWESVPEGLVRLVELARAVPEKADARRGQGDISILERIGRSTLSGGAALRATLAFVGEVTLALGAVLTGRGIFRWRDFLHLAQRAGVEALGITVLVSYLLGLILAFIGAIILQEYGAGIYVADMVAIGMFRDLGALMTAIVMSGRSGAAYAAEIGSMRSTQELDALITNAISPIQFLVVPRVLALALMMPLLTVFADVAGVLGGATVGVGLIGLSPVLYFQQTLGALGGDLLLGGMLKGMAYGVLVGIAGCMRGIQSGNSSLAVGAAATSAVVTSLVWIISACGVFQVVQYLMRG